MPQAFLLICLQSLDKHKGHVVVSFETVFSACTLTSFLLTSYRSIRGSKYFFTCPILGTYKIKLYTFIFIEPFVFNRVGDSKLST